MSPMDGKKYYVEVISEKDPEEVHLKDSEYSLISCRKLNPDTWELGSIIEFFVDINWK